MSVTLNCYLAEQSDYRLQDVKINLRIVTQALEGTGYIFIKTAHKDRGLQAGWIFTVHFGTGCSSMLPRIQS